MTYDELIALEHASWIACLTGVVSRTSRAKVTRAGGVVTVPTGLPIPTAVSGATTRSASASGPT